MASSLGKRRPHVEERNGEAVWVCDGKVWGSWRGKPPATKTPKPSPTAFDRGGVFDTSDLRPAIPALRLADMDRDGVYAQVIYGPIFSIQTDDVALRDECYRVYNDSLAELCSAAPDRLLGVPMLPEFPEAAAREVRRLAARGGAKQANLQIAEAKPRLHDPAWEPFWNALEETGIILSFHVAVFGTKPGDPSFGKPASVFTSTKAFIGQLTELPSLGSGSVAEVRPLSPDGTMTFVTPRATKVPEYFEGHWVEVRDPDANVMAALVECARVRVTQGEMCDVCRKVWGEYRKLAAV